MLLGKRAGTPLVHVPYKGGGPALNDAIAGHVDLFVGSAAIAMPQIKGGKVRPIVQMGEKRTPVLPDVPTAIESGFSDFTAEAWWGFFAPATTRKDLIARFRSRGENDPAG